MAANFDASVICLIRFPQWNGGKEAHQMKNFHVCLVLSYTVCRHLSLNRKQEYEEEEKQEDKEEKEDEKEEEKKHEQDKWEDQEK
ncbi:Uncharacterized protein APZ42_017774 [Daphnia magna]|uniref:Uncharacterized protein n=1 Tax=Daphnia magna TaxID=35525 RepID=A0A164ZLM3_9CRUS|nr:Uncharacterized protein APZ42_017774 [Daphnia magna]